MILYYIMKGRNVNYGKSEYQATNEDVSGKSISELGKLGAKLEKLNASLSDTAEQGHRVQNAVFGLPSAETEDPEERSYTDSLLDQLHERVDTAQRRADELCKIIEIFHTL